MHAPEHQSPVSQLFSTDKIKWAVQLYPSNSDHYPQKSIYAMVNQFTDSINRLRDIDNVHSRAHVDSFCNVDCSRVRFMQSVHFSLTVSPKGATHATAMYRDDGMMMLKDGYRIVVLDDRHWRRFVKMLRKKRMKSVLAPLRIRYASNINGKTILSAQVIKLTNIATISAAIVR